VIQILAIYNGVLGVDKAIPKLKFFKEKTKVPITMFWFLFISFIVLEKLRKKNKSIPACLFLAHSLKKKRI
jgi:hypothetical protein